MPALPPQVCECCGISFTPRRSGARFHSAVCRAAYHKGKRPPADVVRLSVVANDPGTAEAVPEGVLDSVRVALSAAGREGHPTAAICRRLAQRMDAEGDTAAGVSSLAKELRAALAEVLAGAGAVKTPLDEIRARREQKLGGA